MRLFEMTDAQLDAEVQRHYDHMYNEYYHINEPEPCCKICSHYEDGMCGKLLDSMNEEECSEMEACDDWSEVERNEDDYCDDFDQKEPDYPDWMDGDE